MSSVLAQKIRQLLLKIRKIFLISKLEEREGIHQIAFRHGLDRRRHPRVQFPRNFEAFDLPHFEYLGMRFEIIDLSKGGVCLYDPNDDFTLPVGGEGEIFWICGTLKEKIALQVVGISYQKKHLEFKSASQRYTKSIDVFLEPGIWGQKMRKSVLSAQTHIETTLLELWMGIHGSNLSFYSDPHFVASLEGSFFSVNFFRGSLPVHSVVDRKGSKNLTKEEKIQLLLFLWNFPVQSSRLSALLKEWAELELEIQERAG